MSVASAEGFALGYLALPLMQPEFMQAATDTELNKETKTIT